MDFIAGAKIRAERFGDTEPVGVEQAGDARPLFQWCGMHPTQPGIADDLIPFGVRLPGLDEVLRDVEGSVGRWRALSRFVRASAPALFCERVRNVEGPLEHRVGDLVDEADAQGLLPTMRPLCR